MREISALHGMLVCVCTCVCVCVCVVCAWCVCMCVCACARCLSTYQGTIGIFVIIFFPKCLYLFCSKISHELTKKRTYHDTRTGEAIALTEFLWVLKRKKGRQTLFIYFFPRIHHDLMNSLSEKKKVHSFARHQHDTKLLKLWHCNTLQHMQHTATHYNTLSRCCLNCHGALIVDP